MRFALLTSWALFIFSEIHLPSRFLLAVDPSYQRDPKTIAKLQQSNDLGTVVLRVITTGLWIYQWSLCNYLELIEMSSVFVTRDYPNDRRLFSQILQSFGSTFISTSCTWWRYLHSYDVHDSMIIFLLRIERWCSWLVTPAGLNFITIWTEATLARLSILGGFYKGSKLGAMSFCALLYNLKNYLKCKRLA